MAEVYASKRSVLSKGGSPKPKASVRFELPVPPEPIRSPIRRETPSVRFTVADDRDYMKILQQTKIVYDQLLAAKQARLVEQLYAAKAELDQQCARVTDPQQCLEFGVRAQQQLNVLQNEADAELTALQADYQEKLNHMAESLESKWREENHVTYSVLAKNQ